jgi:hypothetical protein
LLYQFGVGLGMLATVRKDGGPRVHPMCPMIHDETLWALIESRGPKCEDLKRDGRYALHCFPPVGNEDAFYLTGTARLAPAERGAELDLRFFNERGLDEVPPQADHTIFELLVDRCLLTRTTGHGDWEPQHTIWRAN